MATPNYSYEKRQRELAKKRKAEEKRVKKNHRDGEPVAPDAEDGANAGSAPGADGGAPAAGTGSPTP